MEWKRYQQRPMTVDAFRWRGVKGDLAQLGLDDHADVELAGACLHIRTNGAAGDQMEVCRPGDILLREHNNRIRTIPEQDFDRNYKRADTREKPKADEPRPVGEYLKEMTMEPETKEPGTEKGYVEPVYPQWIKVQEGLNTREATIHYPNGTKSIVSVRNNVSEPGCIPGEIKVTYTSKSGEERTTSAQSIVYPQNWDTGEWKTHGFTDHELLLAVWLHMTMGDRLWGRNKKRDKAIKGIEDAMEFIRCDKKRCFDQETEERARYAEYDRREAMAKQETK